MGFKKAVKSQSKLRAAMFGPSGAGKTYSALAIASGMGTKIALIDSERSSAAKYADRFDFDQVDLSEKNIDEYVQYINEAASAGYDVLVIDSLSHAWQMLIESVEKLANAKYRGNTWAAWSEGTPEQRKLVNAIVSYPGHVIATMRSKTEWQSGGSEGGKKTGPVRIGLAPEQGKGIEYEFDILFEISPEHLAHIIKDRTGKFQDKVIEKPGKDFGKTLVDWLNEGVPDLINICKNKMVEIGNILTTKDGERSIFNEFEISGVRAKLNELLPLPHEERLPEIEKVLTFWKNELVKRTGQIASSLSTQTAPQKNQAVEPAASPHNPPPPPPSPPPTTRPPIKPGYMTPKTAAQAGADVLSCYQAEEPNYDSDVGFLDDMPYEDVAQSRAAQRGKELEIF